MEKGRERVSKFASINFITKVPFRRNLSTRMRNFLRTLALAPLVTIARVPLEEALNNVPYSIDRFILGDSQTYGLVEGLADGQTLSGYWPMGDKLLCVLPRAAPAVTSQIQR